jgi:hypothetical protein
MSENLPFNLYADVHPNTRILCYSLEMARFKPGDRVRILPTGASPFVGLQGVIDEVKTHPRNLTQLDSYTVLFAWGEKQTFWDAQLEPATEGDPQHRSA